ncbi:unnamed protein product [Ectocarpus fasciculatus]
MEVGNMAYLAVFVEAIIALTEMGKRPYLLPSLKKQLPRVKSKLRAAIQAGVEDGSLVKAIGGSGNARRYGPLGSFLRTLLLIAKTSYKLGSAGGKTPSSVTTKRKKKSKSKRNKTPVVVRRKAVVRGSESATAARRQNASRKKTRASTATRAPAAAATVSKKLGVTEIAAMFWPGRRTANSKKTAAGKSNGKPATAVSKRRAAAVAGKGRAAVARKKTITKGRVVAKRKAVTARSSKAAKR